MDEESQPELNVVCLRNGEHTFIFIYPDAAMQALRSVIRSFTADPEIPFGLADAMALRAKIEP